MQSLKLSNPFAPEPSVASEVRIHALSTTCDVISFNSQGQLCHLTCAGGERSSKPCQNEHDLEKEIKGKNSACM